jgi:hypothetical protein
MNSIRHVHTSAFSSDPKTDKTQCVARGGQRLEGVLNRRERAAKVRAVRVGGVFKKHWVACHQQETTLAVLRFQTGS